MKGVATHIDSESCAVAGNRGGEALTGGHVGLVLSREMNAPSREGWETPGCRRRSDGRKATSVGSISRDPAGPRAVRDPVHAWKHLAREPGDPTFACGREAAGREGNPEGAIRR